MCRRCRGPVSWEYRHGIGWGWWTVIPGIGLTAHCFPFGHGGNADQLHQVAP